MIGYIRIILLFLCLTCIYVYDEPVYGAMFYMLSYLLDALDGVAARALNQCKLKSVKVIIVPLMPY